MKLALYKYAIIIIIIIIIMQVSERILRLHCTRTYLVEKILH